MTLRMGLAMDLMDRDEQPLAHAPAWQPMDHDGPSYGNSHALNEW